MILVTRILPFHETFQQTAHPVRGKEAVSKAFGDGLVEAVHRDSPALAGGFTLLGAGGAGVIAVAARLAGAQRHAAAAACAGGDAGQQDRPGDGARRRSSWIARLERRLHGVEGVRIDDWVDGDRDVLIFGLDGLRLPVRPVEAVFALIGRIRDELVQRPDSPAGAAARTVAMIVEPCRQRLDTHRAAAPVAFLQQPEHQPDHFSFHRIDGKPLLGLRAALLRRHHGIAVGGGSAVPEALPGVLLHCPQHMLAVLLRLIFVEEGKDLPHHHAHGIVAQILRDADQTHAALAQAAHVELQREMIARETAEGMNEDDIERAALAGGEIEHALQFRPAVVRAAGARLDEFRRDLPAPRRAIGERLAPLIGDREIVLRLPPGRNAQVKRGPLRRSRGRLKSICQR